MIDRILRLTVATEQRDNTVPVTSRYEDRYKVGRGVIEKAACATSVMRRSLIRGQWPLAGLLLSAATVACLALGLAGCSQSEDCSGGNYRGGCVAGTPGAASAAGPASAGPASVGPTSISPAVLGPANIGFGDPSTFAAVDDKQCRSYGLIFGTHDYADCRIRLSAQHRGLDPNIGTTTPGPASR
jgi:hypothetical protein